MSDTRPDIEIHIAVVKCSFLAFLQGNGQRSVLEDAVVGILVAKITKLSPQITSQNKATTGGAIPLKQIVNYLPVLLYTFAQFM